MVLKSIVLHNFRCFCDLEVNFNNRLTVVVGNNGAGKSAVLEAAAIAAGTMTFALHYAELHIHLLAEYSRRTRILMKTSMKGLI